MFYLILAALAVFWAVHTVNRMQMLSLKIEESRSGVEVALTRRCDVLKKMLESAGGYLAHEQSVFLSTVQLRRDMTLAQLISTEARLDELCEQILAAAEQHPALHSSRVFQELEYGITDTEAQLEAARRIYNSNVQLYNTAISRFPSSLLAFGRKPAEFFTSKRGVHSDMKITF